MRKREVYRGVLRKWRKLASGELDEAYVLSACEACWDAVLRLRRTGVYEEDVEERCKVCVLVTSGVLTKPCFEYKAFERVGACRWYEVPVYAGRIYRELRRRMVARGLL